MLFLETVCCCLFRIAGVGETCVGHRLRSKALPLRADWGRHYVCKHSPVVDRRSVLVLFLLKKEVQGPALLFNTGLVWFGISEIYIYCVLLDLCISFDWCYSYYFHES